MSVPAVDLEAILALDRSHVLHPISEFRKHEQRGARIFVGGRGVELELADGRRLLDGFSGLFNVNVGHGRSEIADAVAEQMRRLAYYPSFWDFGNEPAARLAERLVALLPADRGLRHVLFGTSGSEANETNFRIARLYHALRGRPAKTRIVSRRWSYHGATRAAGGATGIEFYHALADRDPAHLLVAPPYCYRCEFGKTHPGCCAAGLANLAIVEREGLVENARRTGRYLLERLRKAFGDSPIAGEIRGLGMLAAIEIVRDRERRTPFPNPGDPAWIARAAFENGLIARALFQSIALAPPLCAGEADVDRMVECLEEVWPEAERRFAGRTEEV